MKKVDEQMSVSEQIAMVVEQQERRDRCGILHEIAGGKRVTYFDDSSIVLAEHVGGRSDLKDMTKDYLDVYGIAAEGLSLSDVHVLHELVCGKAP